MTAPLDDLLMRPMAGPGVVARFGNVFLAVAEEPADVAEPVLAQLVDICRAIAAGKSGGRVLVRRLAGLVSASDTDPPAFCAVAPYGGDLIVFVHGDAEVVVRMRGGEQRISGRESVAWVDRLVAWPADELEATAPAAQQVAAQDLLDLRGGIVPGAGFSLGPAAVPTQPSAQAPVEFSLPLEPVQSVQPPLQPLPVLDTGSHALPPPAPETTELAQQSPDSEPPSFESVLLLASNSATVIGDHADDLDSLVGPLPLAADMPTQSLVPISLAPAPEAVLVGGIFCSRRHFNDPDALYCAVCGIGLVQQTRHVVQGPRPPLGVLVLDDGLTYVLDDDYVMGREPGYDEDVREGRALPLPVEDPDGGISRAHAAVRLRGWEVLVCDKGSVNGTYIAPPGGSVWTPLTPFEPVAIRPGTRVQVGRRTFVFDSHHHI